MRYITELKGLHSITIGLIFVLGAIILYAAFAGIGMFPDTVTPETVLYASSLGLALGFCLGYADESIRGIVDG